MRRGGAFERRLVQVFRYLWIIFITGGALFTTYWALRAVQSGQTAIALRFMIFAVVCYVFCYRAYAQGFRASRKARRGQASNESG